MDSASHLLRQARRAAGVGQQELADRAGTSRPTVSAYEHGRKVPSVDTMQRLLSELGCQLSVEPSVVWSQYPAGGGRSAWVASTLWRLPVSAALATVTLPLHLDWSAPGRSHELSDRRQRALLYEIALREAEPAELLAYVDGVLLADLWADLAVPRAVRQAWDPFVTAAFSASSAAASAVMTLP
jgi:transcriptional regulator with XRE-family HTH domain